MDAVKEDMTVAEVTQKNAEDRSEWRWKTAVATPNGRSRKKKFKHCPLLELYVKCAALYRTFILQLFIRGNNSNDLVGNEGFYGIRKC